jgi:uncharacterized OB-fold protein
MMARRPIEPGLFAIPENGDAPRLLASRCGACGAVFHPPRPVCLACHGRELHDTELTGEGVLFACTHVYMPLRPGQRRTRDYWVAQVDLDSGPRVQGLLAAEVSDPRIGMRVGLGLETVRVEEDGDEIVVPHFRAEVAA